MDNNQKLIYYKYLLDTGRIDEITYRDEVNKLKNPRIKRALNTTLETKLTVIVLVVFAVFMAWNIRKSSIKKAFENIDDFYNIPSPVQQSASGQVIKTIDDTDVEITFKYSYVLAGRVVDVQPYLPTKIQNKLSPIDIGVTWGFLARDEYHNTVEWSSAGTRFLTFRTNNTELTSNMNRVTQHLSNNHLIPATDELERQIKSIKEGDYIKLDGYLVDVYHTVGTNGYFKWNSSISRSDGGDGACEVIYVTNLSWLETANQ